MVPCGIAGVTMTSVEHELLLQNDGVCLAPSPTLRDEVASAVIASAGTVFNLEPVRVDAAELPLYASETK